MIEAQVRALFTEIASGEPGASQVDTQLAHRRGRARLRWRRAGVAGAPLVAGATVAVIALAMGAAAPPGLGTGPVAGGPSAPRQFSPLTPYLSFGWLPAGTSLVEGGASKQLVWLTAGRTLDSPVNWSVGVYAARQCHLASRAAVSRQAPAPTAPAGPAGTGPELQCRAPQGITANITGSAPAVRGHRAYWAGDYLVWQYARDGWAELNLPFILRGSPRRPVYQQPAYRRDAIKIANHLRYGAPTPPLLFPVQLTNLPSGWRVSSVDYYPDGKVLRARSYALGAGQPNLGADGGLVYQTGLPFFTIDPFGPRSNQCGRGPAETINGYRVVLHNMSIGAPFHRHDLCAANADGLWVYIMEFGKHPAISVADLFGHHMRLLGRHPAGWTPRPIG
jgi:hypothetical protein